MCAPRLPPPLRQQQPQPDAFVHADARARFYSRIVAFADAYSYPSDQSNLNPNFNPNPHAHAGTHAHWHPYATPTPTPPPEPVCVPNPQQLTSEQAQQIADLPWAQDNPWSVSALRGLATMSTPAFQAWMQRFGDDETYQRLIKAFTSIAVCDEAAALQIVQMPFLDDAGVGAYFEASDGLILEGLARVAQAKRGALEEVLSPYELRGGITDALTAPTLLLILEQEDAAAAAAIRELPWIADGITYIDRDARPTADYVGNETTHVIGFVDRVRRANKWDLYRRLPQATPSQRADGCGRTKAKTALTGASMRGAGFGGRPTRRFAFWSLEVTAFGFFCVGIAMLLVPGSASHWPVGPRPGDAPSLER